ncbi:hypothetical protein [Mangrovivirga cuniculi]|uniref:Uncharacterized protein n=1 Tax=Mangrovivirga cuniculi TaxID=2715131 RepID=A0A4D7JJ81_9BACT|nr:hypothetical protein [Mangrovivirga cuniculi]QCK15651.1 hypothetical protein DCC35_13310 [Mangrovivirga cuniculi]
MFQIDIESNKIEDLKSIATTLSLDKKLLISGDQIVIEEKDLSIPTILLGSVLLFAPWIWLFTSSNPDVLIVLMISLFTILDLWVILNNILSDRRVTIDLNTKNIIIERKNTVGGLIKPKTVISFSEFGTIKKEAKSYEAKRPVFRLYMNTENHNFGLINVPGDNESDKVKSLLKEIIRNS